MDKNTLRDEKKRIFCLEKLKAFSQNSEKLNKKDFKAKVPIQGLLDDTIDTKCTLKRKAEELENYRQYLENTEMLNNIHQPDFNNYPIVNNYFTRQNSNSPKLKNMQISRKNSNTFAKSQSESQFKPKFTRQKTSTLQDTYYSKLKKEEFNELLQNDMIGQPKEDRDKYKSYIVNKYSKCRFVNTLYDLKLSRCRAQSCAEY